MSQDFVTRAEIAAVLEECNGSSDDCEKVMIARYGTDYRNMSAREYTDARRWAAGVVHGLKIAAMRVAGNPAENPMEMLMPKTPRATLTLHHGGGGVVAVTASPATPAGSPNETPGDTPNV